jgi:hypothetical protein
MLMIDGMLMIEGPAAASKYFSSAAPWDRPGRPAYGKNNE